MRVVQVTKMDKESNKGFEYKQNHTFGHPDLYIRLKHEGETYLDTKPNITAEKRKVGNYIINATNISRCQNEDDLAKSHNRIIKTLEMAFDGKNSDSVLTQLSKKIKLPEDIYTEIDFINYGNTQLVYTANLEGSNFEKKLTVLINQPHTLLGVVKNEFDNLTNLHNIDSKFVVEPYVYFSNGDHELYVSSYIEKARCVYGGKEEWSMFDPKPFYHFVPFSTEVANKISSSMIALLVRYYDEKQGRGIAKTQISGDDFILTQEWDKNDPDTILENMKLISARDTIEVSLEDYLDIIRREFLIGTHYRNGAVKNGTMKVNHKSEIAMNEKTIEDGIELGLKLRK